MGEKNWSFRLRETKIARGQNEKTVDACRKPVRRKGWIGENKYYYHSAAGSVTRVLRVCVPGGRGIHHCIP